MTALGRSIKELADWRTLYRPLCLKLFRAYEGILRVSLMCIVYVWYGILYYTNRLSSVYMCTGRKGKR